MRTIQKRTLKEIIKRDQREATRGRTTYYRIDYMSYGYDPQAIAFLQTRNKQYSLYRRPSNKEEYQVTREEYKDPKNNYLNY